MNQVVYIDVLFVVNLIVNYFILLGTKKAVAADASRRRLICGAALGAIYSMIVFFPELPPFLVFLSKLIFSVSIIFVTFGMAGSRRFLKLLAYFYAISFAFAGIMMALWYIASPPGMAISNGVLYVNISPLLLILSSAAAYVLFGLIQRFFGTNRRNLHCRVNITVDNRTASMDALIDTGHALKESFSGAPVIVCEYLSVQALIPPLLQHFFSGQGALDHTEALCADQDWAKRYRMIPCNTVGGVSILPAFRADRVSVMMDGREEEIGGAYIAVSGATLSGGEYHALLSPETL